MNVKFQLSHGFTEVYIAIIYSRRLIAYNTSISR